MERHAEELLQAMREQGIEVEKTVSRFMDNSELYVTFLKRFPDEDRLTPLKNAIAEKSADKTEAAAHKIKGISANLGMTALSDAADVIVQKARKKNLAGAEEDYRLVEKLHNEICAAIKEHI